MASQGQGSRPDRRPAGGWARKVLWGAATAIVVSASPFFAAAPVLAQAAKPAEGTAAKPAAAPMADNGGVDNYQPRKKPRISEAELGRLRMLEIQSGAFREAHKDPGSQQLIGPPLSEREKVMHVMNRLAFGPKQGDVEKLLLEAGTSTDQWKVWVQKQMKPAEIDDAAVEAAITSKFPHAKKTTAEMYKEYPYKPGGGGSDWREPGRELQDQVVYRAVMSNRQLNEVLCEFWRNHLCIDISSGDPKPRAWASTNYEEAVIRPNVFGKFSNMLFASARHPAMLDYLDNQISKANNWNENYARELMELHTVGVDRGYTDFDVIELSKVLTGWQFDRKTYEFMFNEGAHQPGNKKVMGANIPAGYAGGEQAIYALANHPYTANFIATKLCKYFVNDAPPKALVDRVEKVFLTSKGDLPKVYEAIFFSPEFMDRGNFRSKFKTPFEFTVSALRAVDAKLDDERGVNKVLQKMGQEVYNCPDPTGYYDRAEAWLDSGVLTARWDFALGMNSGRVSGVTPNPKVFARYKGQKVDDLYKNVVRELICDDIGDRTRQVLKEAADAGEVSRMYAILIGCPSFQQQ
jgi:uncharacterized protein (DUF1800 family)